MSHWIWIKSLIYNTYKTYSIIIILHGRVLTARGGGGLWTQSTPFLKSFFRIWLLKICCLELNFSGPATLFQTALQMFYFRWKSLSILYKISFKKYLGAKDHGLAWRSFLYVILLYTQTDITVCESLQLNQKCKHGPRNPSIHSAETGEGGGGVAMVCGGSRSWDWSTV